MAHAQLEHNEHAEHAAGHGNKTAALLIAVLAAALAICEQHAKQAAILTQENSISAADTWAQYQAKSIRATLAHDLHDITATLDPPSGEGLASAREKVLARLNADAQRYEKGDSDGKEAIAVRAKAFEAARVESLERTHSFENAVAALELGIVLATASVLTSSGLLIRFAYGLGAAGMALGLLGWLAPEFGAL